MAAPKGIQLNTGRTHFKKGDIPWNKGLKMSDTFKLKISESKKKNPTKYWLGKKRSLETIEKMRSKLIGRKVWNKGKNQLQTTGEKNPNWKGGTSKGYRKGYRDNLEYKKWRASVFKRDDYTCQICGITGVYITAHHTKSWAKYPELRHEVSNGITLCEDCHKLTDNYKGRENKRG
jgi:hypothetical protein